MCILRSLHETSKGVRKVIKDEDTIKEVNINIRLSRRDRDDLKRIAETRGTTASEWIRGMIRRNRKGVKN